MAENIINRNLQNIQDPDTEMNQMIPSGGINFNDVKNYAAIPATYGAALYGNYINKNVGENMARAFRTDDMNQRLSEQVGNQLPTGVNSGGLTYTDFGLDPVREYIGDGEYRNTREFNAPSFEKFMSLNSADAANALTLGNLNFNKDPSGNINYTGNRFDFPQPTFMNNNPVDIPLDELNVNAPQFSFTDYLQGNYDLNQNIPSSKPADAISRTNVQGMDLEMDPGAFMNPNIQPSQNMFQRAGNAIQGGLGSIRDFAVDKGMSARNLLGSGAAMAMGLPGIVGSGAMSLLGGLGNMFEDRQLSGGLGTIVDEYGRSYTAEELNKQNALGGYYTDPARASRRRAKSIFKLGNRKNLSDAGKRRLEKLKAQELIQEQARQEAARQMQDSNRSSGRGGYQAGYSGDFMEGDPNAGGRATTATMGSFRDGGLAVR